MSYYCTNCHKFRDIVPCPCGGMPTADLAKEAAVSENLKPCPIPSCGGMASYEETEEGDHYVECVDCGYCGKSSMSFDAAVDWWNTRPIEDALRAEVEELTTERNLLSDTCVDLRAEVARLQAELAKYTGPLTWSECFDVHAATCDDENIALCDDDYQQMLSDDAAVRAIRAAREGER